MSYLGSWKIDDIIDIPAVLHSPATGAITDATGSPAWRIYEQGTVAAIQTGTLSKRDSQTGFYTGNETLSAGNGYEKGKHYIIKITGVVGGITGGIEHNFQIGAEVDANTVSDKTGYALTVTPPTSAAIADAVLEELIADHTGTAGSLADFVDRALDNTRILSFRKNSALNNWMFTIRDSNGVPLTGRTVTPTRILDDGSEQSMTSLVSEVGSTGVYRVDISAADTNGDTGAFIFTPNTGLARTLTFRTTDQ